MLLLLLGFKENGMAFEKYLIENKNKIGNMLSHAATKTKKEKT